MKNTNIRFLLGLFLVITVSACSSKSKLVGLENGKKIDNRLVGEWQGSEEWKQFKDSKKEWEVNRKSDGTESFIYRLITNGEAVVSEQSGNWWVEGDKFYEQTDYSENIDAYNFAVLNKNQVQFKKISTDVNFADANYTFIDTRKATEETLSKKKNDGLSLETAIKVKSVGEEYNYVRNNCTNCQMEGQALLQHKGKPYDKLNVKNAKGETLSYYFDISSFFGKW